MQHLNLIFEAIACIIFIVTSGKNKSALFYLLGFLVVSAFINECAGIYMNNNAAVYSIYDVVSLCIYSFIFYQLFPQKKTIHRVFTISVAVIITILMLVNGIAGYGTENYYKLQVLTGGYLVLLSCYCLYNEFVNDDMSDFLIKKPGFWVSSGVLIFYSGYSLVIILNHFAYSNQIFLAGLSVHHFFANALGVFLYTCMSVAIILCKPTLK